MAKPGLRKIYRYSDEFKSTAVRLSQMPGVAVKDVAASLDIHPFMLSRWRKEHREAPRVSSAPRSIRRPRPSCASCASSGATMHGCRRSTSS